MQIFDNRYDGAFQYIGSTEGYMSWTEGKPEVIQFGTSRHLSPGDAFLVIDFSRIPKEEKGLSAFIQNQADCNARIEAIRQQLAKQLFVAYYRCTHVEQHKDHLSNPCNWWTIQGERITIAKTPQLLSNN